MSKRILSFMISLVIILTFSTLSFTQDQPAGDTEVTTEKPADTTTADTETIKKEEPAGVVSAPEDKEDTAVKTISIVGEPDEIKFTAGEAKIYFDGYNTYINNRVAYKLSAPEDVEAYKIYFSINSGEEKVYSKPFTLTKEGSHVIKYQSADRMERRGNGNVFTLVLDNSAPETALLADKPVILKEKTLYASKSHVFFIRSTDRYSGVSRIEYGLNSDEMAAYANPFILPQDKKESTLKITSTDNVTISTKRFILQAQDQQGQAVNVSDSMVTLTIDDKSPDVSIKPDKEMAKKNDKNIVAVPYIYTVSAADEESGVNAILVRVDGEKQFREYKEPLKFNDHGKHIIEAKAVDKVGNISEPVSLAVYVDTAPPVTTIKALTDDNEQK
ncbi:MAG: hypothetical protein CVV44_01400 [Spirochaetae bacterium HGW-Spirochaetae-1]|nr:MAG: hypothetical protein CVV44_01400 [Spirochaetae bacterium HGW-Spirochaetae-1]